jgi:hypothetical protein
MSDGVLEGLASEIGELRARLEAEDLDAEAATQILERITALAQDALAEIERRSDALEGPGSGEPAR